MAVKKVVLVTARVHKTPEEWITRDARPLGYRRKLRYSNAEAFVPPI